MKVIVLIEGREAIPVRAIPLLTNWEVMSPDELAGTLAGDERFYKFRNMSAYRRENGESISIPARWWENFPCRELQALSDRIKATEISHETGYQEWRRQSLPLLPAGVFVWKDEFVPLYDREFKPENITFLSTKSLSGVMAPDEHKRRTALDFNPFIADLETCRVVMEGFEEVKPEPHAAQAQQVDTAPTGVSGRLPSEQPRVVDALTGLIEEAASELGASASPSSVSTKLFQWALHDEKPGRLVPDTTGDLLRFRDGRFTKDIKETALKQRIRRCLRRQDL